VGQRDLDADRKKVDTLMPIRQGAFAGESKKVRGKNPHNSVR
jgi:hypothetical protein